jgi:thiol-disulfide isomerase/thioredoxin
LAGLQYYAVVPCEAIKLLASLVNRRLYFECFGEERYLMRIILIAAVVISCVAAGFWFSQNDEAAQPNELAVLQVMPDFTLPDLDNQPQSIKNWAGRSLIINFWATWCGPCRREMPLLQKLQDERSGGSLQIIGVAVDNLAAVKQFISKSNVTYPILYGEEEGTLIAESFGDAFIGLPFTVFVTPSGEIIKLMAGELHTDQLYQIVAELDAVASGKRTAVEAYKTLESH